MQEPLVQAMRNRRPQIRERWEALLRAERPSTALAHPETLVHLLDWSLDEVLRTLALRTAPRRSPNHAHHGLRAGCACGRNPLLHFFIAGEQALLEGLVLAQVNLPDLEPNRRDRAVTELYLVVRGLARDEVASFCSLCQHRATGTALPHVADPRSPANSSARRGGVRGKPTALHPRPAETPD